MCGGLGKQVAMSSGTSHKGLGLKTCRIKMRNSEAKSGYSDSKRLSHVFIHELADDGGNVHVS